VEVGAEAERRRKQRSQRQGQRSDPRPAKDRANRLLPIAIQNEGRPIAGMSARAACADEAELRGTERFGLGFAVRQMAIKRQHEIRGRAVFHSP
jgi:hypothetical protein